MTCGKNKEDLLLAALDWLIAPGALRGWREEEEIEIEIELDR